MSCHYFHPGEPSAEPCLDYAHCHAKAHGEPDPCHRAADPQPSEPGGTGMSEYETALPGLPSLLALNATDAATIIAGRPDVWALLRDALAAAPLSGPGPEEFFAVERPPIPGATAEDLMDYELDLQRLRIAYDIEQGRRHPCSVPSAVTGQPCLLYEGHPQDTEYRFHRYRPAAPPPSETPVQEDACRHGYMTGTFCSECPDEVAADPPPSEPPTARPDPEDRWRLVRIGTEALSQFGTRTEDGRPITAEWGEPDKFGVYEPTFTVGALPYEPPAEGLDVERLATKEPR